MSIIPIITFKAGQCELDTSSKPYKVKPLADPGYVYLYSEEDLIHFCWRKRDAQLTEPDLDLVMVPADGSFVPYEPNDTPQPSSARTNGRIFSLKFSSSSQRYVFWLQSKPQSRDNDASWLSPRDRKIGEIVNRLLQGEEVNVRQELASVRNTDDRPEDDDEAMEDAEGHGEARDHPGSGSGGAGPDATGGDVREEGESAREGGADGARAATGSSGTDAAAAVRDLLASLGGRSDGPGQNNRDRPYPYLHHLLPTSITVPMIDNMAENSPERLDTLLNVLPPAVIILASNNPDAFDGKNEPSSQAVAEARASMSMVAKTDLLKKVLRSPQFHQALGILTHALRDGGLPSVAGALGIRVDNGGYVPGGTMPLGGGHAVEAFVEGVKKTVQDN